MHSISVFLIKKEELRNEKIDSLTGENKISNINFTEMGCGILATTKIPNLKQFSKDKTITKIGTDYFGGSGHQSAILKINGEIVYSESSEFNYMVSPINNVLKMMGVVKNSNMDEFDTIGLGKYRRNEDFQ